MLNDSDVRLRTGPDLSSSIIRKLVKNEQVDYITSQDLFDGSDYKWINVKTKYGNGWVYGEFVVRADGNKSLLFVEDVGIQTRKSIISSGDKKERLISELGQPIKSAFDQDKNEDSLVYGDDQGLIFLVYRYNNRIHQIIIKSSSIVLANGIKVGSKLPKESVSLMEKVNETKYTTLLRNMFKSSFYDSAIIITTDKNGVISEIQIGLPE